MDRLLQDLKYAFRIHAKTFGVSLICVLTIALGIGASTVVFSVANAILLKPLPYVNSGEIVIPWRMPSKRTNLGYTEIPWNTRSYRLFMAECKTFQTMGAFRSVSLNLTGTGDPALVEGLQVSSGFFPSLGVAPILGRTFTPDEDEIGRDREVILSYQLWQDRFGGDRNILGKAIDLNGFPYSIVGVMPPEFDFPRSDEMPPGFDFPENPQFWTPLGLPTVPPPNIVSDLAIVGRLKSGFTSAQVQEELNVLAIRQEKDYPRLKGTFNAHVVTLSRQVAGDTRQPLLLMLGAVAIVLLIACSNVANLFLARSLGRNKELVVRAALGARQSRLLRQLLTETFLLTTIGGMVGVLLAQIGIHFVKILGPSNIPRLREVAMDFRVLVFSLCVTILAAVVVGLGPALAITRKNLGGDLKDGVRSSGSVSSSGFRKAFLVSEVALAFVLVVAAGLLVRTFYHLLSADVGFNSTNVLTFQLSLPESKYSSNSSVVNLYRNTMDKFRNLPGVESVGIVYKVPMGGSTEGTWLRLSDQPVPNAMERPFSKYTITSPGYFVAIGTPLLRGRDFLDSDAADSAPVAVINEVMAKKFWPGVDPIGKQVAPASKDYPLMTIVGIVADVKRISFRETPGPEVYVPYTQKVYPSMLVMQVVLRTKAAPLAAAGTVREALRSIDPDLPVAKLTTLKTVVDNVLAQPRFSMLLLASFSAIALLLASIGLYGVVSYSVVQRTQEIGIRMALGARRESVLSMVLGEGVRLAALGIGIGFAAALGLTRLISSFLYGVRSTDPLTFVSVVLLLVFMALIASYLPARRATRVDPMVALRTE